MADMEQIYTGDPEKIHIREGGRGEVGHDLAGDLDSRMRRECVDPRTEYELLTQRLCSGCYMIALFNAALTLADGNGQDRVEMAKWMVGLFTLLANNPEMGLIEEIASPEGPVVTSNGMVLVRAQLLEDAADALGNHKLAQELREAQEITD